MNGLRCHFAGQHFNIPTLDDVGEELVFGDNASDRVRKGFRVVDGRSQQIILYGLTV
jgi:hypothetical protein